ncbi:MAG: hypothetical protein WAW17_20520 [Rhodococcus sp. (in: high G+C Gram-positive bacteria)]|uniref:hypothetical protein n=1 Tax=Rhodococcus sp. TaxID=1831 RepID=UPI003BB021AE
MAENLSPRKVGRPSKGDRKLVKAFVPIELKKATAATAARKGLTETDYIVALLAADTGLTHFATPHQEELPLPETA